MAITVSNGSELRSALNSTSGGETIELASGNYGSVDLSGFNFSEKVTITSQEQLGATFNHIDMSGSSGMTLSDVTVHVPNGNQDRAVWIRNSDDIDIVNSELKGSVDGNFTNDELGMKVENSSSINVSNNEMHNFFKGAKFRETTDLTVRENNVHDMQKDGLNFVGVQDVLVENNLVRDMHPVEESAHTDFIQFWNIQTDMKSSDVTIRGNALLQGNEFQTQGMFIGDPPSGGYQNFTIEDNLIYTSHVHGITGANLQNSSVSNNTVLTAPGVDWDATIRPSGDNIELKNNVTTGFRNKSGADDASGNLVVQYTDPNGENYYGDLFQNAFDNSGISVEDLMPVAGSKVDFGSGMGAEERLQEIANGANVGGRVEDGSATDGNADDTTSSDDTTTDDSSSDGGSTDGSDSGSTDGGSTGGDETTDGGQTGDGVAYELGERTFDGSTGSAVVVPHDPAFATEEGTLAMTFTPDSASGAQGLFSKDSTGFDNGGHLTVRLVDGSIEVRLQSDSASHEVVASKAVSAGETNTMALTFGNDGMQLYVNGELADSAGYGGGMANNAEPMVIGANQWASGNESADVIQEGFDGTIASTKLFTRALTQDEVSNLGNSDGGSQDDTAETGDGGTSDDGGTQDGADGESSAPDDDAPADPGEAEGPSNVLMLGGEDQTVEVPFDAQVRGTSAPETVNVGEGAHVQFGANDGDSIELAGDFADYDLTSGGNTLSFVNGDTRADVSLNAETEIVFGDGMANADIGLTDNGVELTLGGQAVGSDFDRSEVNLDGSEVSGDDAMPAMPSQGGPAPVQTGTSAGENIDGNQDGTIAGNGGDDRFVFGQQQTDVEITDFSADDQLLFTDGVTEDDVVVSNADGGDGSVSLAVGEVGVTVTGISAEADGGIADTSTFEGAFGVDSLAFA
ncbi:Right handed beta helix region [Limimonas halophila]|uniref:Right handed beta helix region n=1 Tax=Limimonas halophila TaxID=1082479 RepID=A0A1G7NP61_9PROT|nr:LamG domain-containing protein [Limimonas halophila]SDF75060.1 Right handed beta helix region [Limimonas halophila]